MAVAMQQIEGLHLPGGRTLKLPEELRHWIVREGAADFHGRFDDFTADVEATGNMGNLRASGIYHNNMASRHFQARFQTQGLPLQPLLHSPMLGSLTAQGEISGNGSNIEDYRLNIQSLHLHGRELCNAMLHGDMEDERLTFKLHSPDSALLADINGFVDFRENKIYYAGELNRFDLSAFHFLPEDSNAILSLHSQADLTGRVSQGIHGVIKVNNASLTENGNKVRIPPFQLLSDTAENGDMELQLRSTPLQASISGKLRLADIPSCLTRLAQQHLPHSIGKNLAEVPDYTTFNLAVTMKQPIRLLERLLPNLHIGGACSMDAYYSEPEQKWWMQSDITALGWKQIRWENCSIEDYLQKIEDKINKEVEKAAKRFENFDEQMFRSTNARVLEHQKKYDEVHSRFAECMEKSDWTGLKALIEELEIACPISGTRNWTDVRQFNLMFATQMGSVAEGTDTIYLRPETAQGIFVNYLNVQKTGRMKIPFGIAQIGKAFRNEIVARQFIFRMKEFEQMEMQFSGCDATQRETIRQEQQFKL